MPKSANAVVAIAALVALASCGGESPGGGEMDDFGMGLSVGAEAGESASAPPKGEASAEQVAREQRGNLKCPAAIKTPRPPGAPVDDVVGVRPGMSYEEAVAGVLCDNPMLVAAPSDRGFSINTFGQKLRWGFEARFAEPRVVKSGRDIMREMQEEQMRRSSNAYVAPLEPGQTRFFVGTVGLPQKEKVVSVSREEYYVDGKFPPVETLREALIAKYGQPTKQQEEGPALAIQWNYDTRSRLITETSPLFGRCGIAASPDFGVSLNPDCGISISAAISRSRENQDLAQSIAVSSGSQAEGYAALDALEQALLQADELRKAQELKDAAKNSGAPKL